MTHDPRPAPAARPARIDPARIGVRLAAEGIGSFVVVLAILGVLLFAGGYAGDDAAYAPGIVFLAASVAAGLASGLAALAFGPVSGGHINPAVTVGLAAAGRFAWRDAWRYVLAQTVGALFASTVVVLVGLFGPSGWLAAAQEAGFGANGWGGLSPAGFGLPGAILVETALTGLLVVIVLGVTRGRAAISAVAIGFGTALVYLVAVPVDGGGSNPARSLAAAIYGGVEPLAMLWVFLVFPFVGALLAGIGHRALFDIPARD